MSGPKTLSALAGALLHAKTFGALDVPITGVTCDSREVRPGYVMVCIAGSAMDGHRFATDAIQRGAVALVLERPVPGTDALPRLIVPDGRRALAALADRFHGHPSGALDVVGVTGTNGKTTFVAMARAIARAGGVEAASIGTLGVRSGTESPGGSALNTTPGADRFQERLAALAGSGTRAVMVEVSSHALDMRRTDGTDFRVVALTNLSRDHLDWHGSFDAYRDAKSRLFQRSEWGLDAEAVTNRARLAVLPADDPFGAYVAERTDLDVVRYGFDRSADWRLVEPVVERDRCRARLVGPDVHVAIDVPLPGRFNLRNAAAAAAACAFLGVAPDAIAGGLAALEPVPGRMERVEGAQPFDVIVDYAHTPDALATVLSAVREFAGGRIICVIGAGGNRDRGKRPEMARAAVEGSDLVIFTSDNPRSEDPEAILDDLVADLSPSDRYRRVADRTEAVRMAIGEARAGDLVLIAGKGHERTQKIGGRTIPLDDRQLALDALATRGYADGDEAGGAGGR